MIAYFEMFPPNHALSSPLFRSDEEGKTLLLECGDRAVFTVVTQAGESLRRADCVDPGEQPCILPPVQTPNRHESTAIVILVAVGR